jgi:UDP-N-acetyl-2-amino-2-deoxyglucuronate dehydrogenase
MTHKVAIIGVGAVGWLHAKAIADLDNVELVAGFGLDAELGKKFTAEFGAVFYDDYQKMLDESGIEFVTIATPSGAHLEPALAAIERGISVLCEKPLEIKLDRIDAMIAAADKANVALGGIFPQRFNPVVQAVYDAAAAGRFGDIAVINSYVPWWRDDAYYAPGRWQGTLAMDGGGALMNQSIHGVDVIQWIAGATMDLAPGENPVEELFAYTGKRGHADDLIEVEDTCVVSLKYRNGAMGQILATTSMYPGSFRRLTVAGRGGTAETLEDQLVTWTFQEETDEDSAVRERFGKSTEHGGGAADPMAIDYGMHTQNIAAFVSDLEAGRTPKIDGVESRKALAIIDAVYRSAASGEVVQVT